MIVVNIRPEGTRFEAQKNFVRSEVSPCRTLDAVLWGCNSMVEELPFKQRVAGSTPAIPRKIRGVAQRLEQLPDTQLVEGSIPSAPTMPVCF